MRPSIDSSQNVDPNLNSFKKGGFSSFNSIICPFLVQNVPLDYYLIANWCQCPSLILAGISIILEPFGRECSNSKRPSFNSREINSCLVCLAFKLNKIPSESNSGLSVRKNVKSLGIARPKAWWKGSKKYDPGRICQASWPLPTTRTKAEGDGLKYRSSRTDNVFTAPRN